MNTYVSVDLDYWGMSETGYKKSIVRFLNRLNNLNLPIYVTESHEEILPHLNKFKVDKIYQIDFHNDIVNDPVTPRDLNEGTWANYYKYRKDCIFEWRYPSVYRSFLDGWGRCDWIYSKTDPYEPEKMGYKKVLRRQGLGEIDLHDVKGLSVTISRNWWEHDDIDFIFDKYDFLKKFKE